MVEKTENQMLLNLQKSVLSACAMKFLGGVQCAQYCPHPLYLWFISHDLASWDGDSEVLGL